MEVPLADGYQRRRGIHLYLCDRDFAGGPASDDLGTRHRTHHARQRHHLLHQARAAPVVNAFFTVVKFVTSVLLVLVLLNGLQIIK